MTFATKFGRAIGYSAAATAHGACVAATYTGQFGKDVVAGTSAGYVDHSVRLAELRAKARPTSIAIQVVVPAALKAKLAKA